jgi:hypothetical protein
MLNGKSRAVEEVAESGYMMGGYDGEEEAIDDPLGRPSVFGSVSRDLLTSTGRFLASTYSSSSASIVPSSTSRFRNQELFTRTSLPTYSSDPTNSDYRSSAQLAAGSNCIRDPTPG